MIVDYCVEVVDLGMNDKRTTLEEQPDAATQRRIQGELYQDQVKVRCISCLAL